MGNSALIMTKDGFENGGIGLYLHWNGGRDSVEPFLKYCKIKGYRPPETDGYGWARLAQVVGNFFGGSDSVGIEYYGKDSDFGYLDNGVYIIENWNIIDRKHFEGIEQDNYNPIVFLKNIDECMPIEEQLGEALDAIEVPTTSLQIGDEVFMEDFYGKYEKFKVIGFGEDKYVNGQNVKGIPYVNRYDHNDGNDYTWNVNNYVRTETVLAVKR